MKRNKPNHQMKAGNICEGSSLLSGQNQYQKEERKQKADNVKQPVMKKQREVEPGQMTESEESQTFPHPSLY